MLRRQQIKKVAFAVFLIVSALGARCEAPELIPPDKNRPPETTLTSAPDSSDVTHFRVHLFWSGFDPDGTVSEWQYAIDDTIIRPEAVVVGTGWIRTTKTDSVFIFSASTNGTDQTRDHRFFVSSIDNEGKPDPTPALVDFTARTICYPVPAVIEGPAEAETLDVFSSVRLCWGGSDCDGEILEMQYMLAPLEIGFRTVALDEQNCVTYENLPSNRSRDNYRFLLVAQDDAGSRNLTPVERRFVVNHDPDTEITRFFSIHATGNPSLANLAITPGDTIPDSSKVTFSWRAEDVDGAIKGSFWQIDGLNFFADTSLASQAEVREATVQWLTSDIGGARLIVGTLDEYDRAEGSPDTIPFFVNLPPTVTIRKPVLSPVLAPNNSIVVGWTGFDRDGPTRALEFDVDLRRDGVSVIPPPRVEAGEPDSLTFVGLTTGSYEIIVTPVDRRGAGKVGPPATARVFVLTGSDAAASPAIREEKTP